MKYWLNNKIHKNCEMRIDFVFNNALKNGSEIESRRVEKTVLRLYEQSNKKQREMLHEILHDLLDARATRAKANQL